MLILLLSNFALYGVGFQTTKQFKAYSSKDKVKIKMQKEFKNSVSAV